MIDSLETLPFSPTSHSTGSALQRLVGAPPVVGHDRDPVLARRPPSCTPRMPLTFESSKLFSLPPNTGHCTTEACSMPGRRTSAV